MEELKAKQKIALLELNSKGSQFQSTLTKLMFYFIEVFPGERLEN